VHYKRNRSDYYLVFVVGGSCTFYLDGSKHELSQGNLFLYYPNQAQEYIYAVENKPVVFWVHFMGDGATKLIEKLELHAGKHDLSNAQDVFVLFNKLVDEYKIMSLYYEEYAIGILYRLLTLIGRYIKNVERNDKFIRIIEKIYADPLTSNEELAQICHYSTMHFIRKFKKQYGMTPLKFKQRILIDKAKDLLKNESLTVTQIAVMLGFESEPLYFNKLFKSCTGVSPSKYREMGQRD
jgi:AraC-like DNA-binding protein